MKDKLNIIFCSAILIFFESGNLLSQNLVPNGGFEEHSDFEVSYFERNTRAYLKYWKSGNIWECVYCHNSIVAKYGYNMFKKYSYFKYDTTNVFEGRAMVKMVYEENCPVKDTGCVSYLKTKLIAPLQIGEIYEISLWVFTEFNPSYDTAQYNRIGIYLSKKELPWNPYGNMISADYYFTTELMPGKWTQIKKYVRALCTLEYVAVGMFRDSSFRPQYRGINNPLIFYIDNVSINKIDEDSISSDIFPTPYCEYYERESQQRIQESITELTINYESNSYLLDKNDKLKLDSFILANENRKNKVFIVLGYSDSEKADNQFLSENRSIAIGNYLKDKFGFNKRNILEYGLGSDYPIASNSTMQGRSLNRRAVIRTSDLTGVQILYRTALGFIKRDSFESSYLELMRWIKVCPGIRGVEMLVDPRLNKLKQTIYWKHLDKEVRKMYYIYNSPDKSFYLDSMYFEDQKYRTYNPYILTGIIEEIDTSVLPEFILKESNLLYKDSINYAAIKNYLLKNGYPKISEVGRRQSRAAGFILLHHYDKFIFEKYIPILKSLCEIGECEWDIFAKMSDKLAIINDQPQQYGTQFDRGEDGEVILYKIEDINDVNSRRAKLGMAPIVEIEK